MPIDQRRRVEIAAAVATYDSANPETRLPRSTVPLLAAMFPIEDVCQRSLDDIAAGFLSRVSELGRAPDTYRLHLPPVRR